MIRVAGTGPGAAAALLSLARRGVRTVALEPGEGPGYDDELPHVVTSHGAGVLQRLGVWGQAAAQAHHVSKVQLLGAKGRAASAHRGSGGLWLLAPRWLETVLLRAAREAGIVEAADAGPLAIVDEPCLPDFRHEVVVLQPLAGYGGPTGEMLLSLGDGGPRWLLPTGAGGAVVGAAVRADDAGAAIAAFQWGVGAALSRSLGGTTPAGSPVIRGVPRPVTARSGALVLRAPDPVPSLLGDCGVDMTLETGLLAAEHGARVALDGADAREAADAYARKARWLTLPNDGMRWAGERVLRSHLAGAAVALASLRNGLRR